MPAVSLKIRLVGVFSSVLALIALAAGVAIVVNARVAVEAEVEAGMELATTLVERTIAGADSPQAAVAAIRAGLGPVPTRHVRIAIEGDPDAPAEHASGPGGAPAWFVGLVAPAARRTALPIPLADGGLVTAVVAAMPEDEIAEVWNDVRDLGLIVGVLFVGAIGAVHYAVGRTLRPLHDLSRGLARLERHDYQMRLPPIPVAELKGIGETVNALAGSLERVEAENRRLNRTLIAMQDSERRQIASEIHDELGPCLFGIRVEARAILQAAEPAPAPPAAMPGGADVAGRARAILEVTDNVQKLSRRLLDRLRPMALEHLPLSAVLADMVDRWRRHQPDIDWRLFLPDGDDAGIDRIDDSAAVTLYRVLQESLMNAARHAHATAVEADIGWREQPGGRAAVTFRIRDDGRGFAEGSRPGVGTQGMMDRVQALGGSLNISSRPGGGVTVEGEIPIAERTP